MKRIIIASLLIVVLVASCLAVFAACNNKEDWEYIEDKGTLIVGVTDYEPMDLQKSFQTINGLVLEKC